MATMRALKRASSGPTNIGPVVGVRPAAAEVLQELAPKPPLALRMTSVHEGSGSALNGGRAPMVVQPYRWSGSQTPQNGHVAAPPPQPATSDGWTLELTESERRYLESSLSGLTTREREVVFEICAGGTNETMADRLCVALPTVRTHLMRLNQKLGTTSKGDVVRFVAARLLEGYRRGSIWRPPEPA